MITKTNVKIGKKYKRPCGDIVKVTAIFSNGFLYCDVKNENIGGWHPFRHGKYLQEIK